MPSTLKSETARINGAKSRGPIIAAGLEKSAQNAVTHGLTSRGAVVLACESQEEFDGLLNQFVVDHQPANRIEMDLVEEMAVSRWRIRRLWEIETSLLDSEFLHRKSNFEGTDRHHLAQSFRYIADDSRALALSLRYQSQLHRTYDRAFASLRALQHARKSQPQPAQVPEASCSEPCADSQPSLSHDRPHLVQSRPILPPNPEPQPPVPGPQQELRNEPTGPSSPEPPISA